MPKVSKTQTQRWKKAMMRAKMFLGLSGIFRLIPMACRTQLQ
jgi:hypothetical protein